jgi:ERCC4-type nuclease
MALEIVVDTREQIPFDFVGCGCDAVVTVKKLTTGDYSVAGLEDQITIERKSLAYLYGSCGKNGRERFEREIVRMAKFRYAAIVVEEQWGDILCRPPVRSKLPSKCLLASLMAWSVRFGIQIWPCPGVAAATKFTFRLLERFKRDVDTGFFR